MRSIRFSFRARIRDRRGYALISAIVLAVLFFLVMELMLMESSRALEEAQRFRSRIVGLTLAENAAELMSRDLIDQTSGSLDADDDDGHMHATLERGGSNYKIESNGVMNGVKPIRETVVLQGRVVGNHITIDYAAHSQ